MWLSIHLNPQIDITDNRKLQFESTLHDCGNTFGTLLPAIILLSSIHSLMLIDGPVMSGIMPPCVYLIVYAY